MKRFISFLLVCVLGFGLSLVTQASNRQATPPDNTKTNKRDRERRQPTADQQNQNRPDREITREIRRSITNDKGLSTYARNIKIITQDGNVTLRGPVRTEEEKRSVEAKANEVVGASHVKSEIEIAAKQTGKKNP
jgi:hyperosmotically inducible periplasmic protein